MEKNKSEKNSEIKYQQLDIEKIIRNQENKIVKNLPKFIINLIKKSFHQDEMNEILRKNHDKYGTDFVNGVTDHMEYKIVGYNEKVLPESGKYIFASNHPNGGADFAAVTKILSNKYKNIKLIANELFLHVENAKDMFLPVSILKRNEKGKINDIDDHLADIEGQLLIFPAGKVARKIKGKLDDGPWHRSFIRNAVLYKRDVIPMFVGGENSKKFYRWARTRAFFGIKANPEFFLLPGEVFKKRGATIPVVFGEPIPYTTFDDSKTHFEWAQEVKKTVYELGEKYL
ncbi:MAG: hypothetical protein L3J56_04395 [Bacteroidales bacterium]|nr:hypothetical protein [Bacteroidales bacterium]